MNDDWRNDWVFVADTDAVASGVCRRVDVAELPFAVLLARLGDGEAIAVAIDACPVDGHSLGDAPVRGSRVSCELHGLALALDAEESGEHTLSCLPVMVVDDEVFVNAPDDAEGSPGR